MESFAFELMMSFDLIHNTKTKQCNNSSEWFKASKMAGILVCVTNTLCVSILLLIPRNHNSSREYVQEILMPLSGNHHWCNLSNNWKKRRLTHNVFCSVTFLGSLFLFRDTCHLRARNKWTFCTTLSWFCGLCKSHRLFYGKHYPSAHAHNFAAGATVPPRGAQDVTQNHTSVHKLTLNGSQKAF